MAKGIIIGFAIKEFTKFQAEDFECLGTLIMLSTFCEYCTENQHFQYVGEKMSTSILQIRFSIRSCIFPSFCQRIFIE